MKEKQSSNNKTIFRSTRVGIVGAGFIVKEFLDNVSLIENIEVTGIFSRTFANAKQLSDEYGIPEIYSSFDDLLKSNIDVVYVATQNNTHFMYSQKALFANKHVLCEKPAGVNFNELYELISIANERNLKFMEAMRVLYMPAYLKLKEILDSKVFGEIISIEGSLGRVSTRLHRHTKDLCGGALLDLGIYPITAVIDILGVPNDIKASCIKNDQGVDSTTSVILTYASSQVANIYVSFVSNTRKELRICCERGVITLPASFTTTDIILLEDGNGKLRRLEFKKEGTGMVEEIIHFISKPSKNLNNELSTQVIRVLDKIRKDIDVLFDCDVS